MAFWQVDPATATDPAVVEVAAGAACALTVDTARHGDPARRALPSTLTDLETGATVPLDAPTLAAGVITQVVRGLIAKHDYKLSYTWIVSVDDQPTRSTIVRCLP